MTPLGKAEEDPFSNLASDTFSPLSPRTLKRKHEEVENIFLDRIAELENENERLKKEKTEYINTQSVFVNYMNSLSLSVLNLINLMTLKFNEMDIEKKYHQELIQAYRSDISRLQGIISQIPPGLDVPVPLSTPSMLSSIGSSSSHTDLPPSLSGLYDEKDNTESSHGGD